MLACAGCIAASGAAARKLMMVSVPPFNELPDESLMEAQINKR